MQVPVWVSSVRHLPFLVGPPRAYLIDSYVTHRALPYSSSVASYHPIYIYLPSLRLFVHDLPVSTAVPAVRHSSGASCIFLVGEGASLYNHVGGRAWSKGALALPGGGNVLSDMAGMQRARRRVNDVCCLRGGPEGQGVADNPGESQNGLATVEMGWGAPFWSAVSPAAIRIPAGLS